MAGNEPSDEILRDIVLKRAADRQKLDEEIEKRRKELEEQQANEWR